MMVSYIKFKSWRLLALPFLERAILFILVPVILAAIYPLVYSYHEYQREIRSG